MIAAIGTAGASAYQANLQYQTNKDLIRAGVTPGSPTPPVQAYPPAQQYPAAQAGGGGNNMLLIGGGLAALALVFVMSRKGGRR